MPRYLPFVSGLFPPLCLQALELDGVRFPEGLLRFSGFFSPLFPPMPGAVLDGEDDTPI